MGHAGGWNVRRLRRPYSWRRRVRRNLSRLTPGLRISPRQSKGTERRAAHPYSIHALRRGRPWRRARAPRRSIAAFSFRHRAALSNVPLRLASSSQTPPPFLGGSILRASGKPRGPPSASSSQGVIVPPGGAPVPPECARSVPPRPQAPHRRCRVHPISALERRLHHLDASR